MSSVNNNIKKIITNQLESALMGNNKLPMSSAEPTKIYLNFIGFEEVDGEKIAFYGARFNTSRMVDMLLAAIPASRMPNCNTIDLANLDFAALFIYRKTLLAKQSEKHPDLDFRKLSSLNSLASNSNENSGIQLKLVKANAQKREYIPQNGVFMESFKLYANNGNTTTLVNSTSLPLGEALLSGDCTVVF